MKRYNIFTKIFIVLFILISLSAWNSSEEKDDIEYISIEKHLINNSIDAKIISKGGFQGECMSFFIQNLIKDTLNILLEPGRRLVSYDSSIQDILIVKKRKIRLAPLAKILIPGYGFCCQSSKGGPSKDKKYKIGYMAPKTWIRLAELIDKNNFPIGAIQSAIWVLSDNHPISSIHYDKTDKIKLLRETVADIKGIELPWYTLTFENDTSRLFSNRPEMLWGKINYKLKNNTVVSINIRNSEGTVVKTLVDKVAKGPGKYVLNLKLPIKNWPKGDYFIYIIEDYANLNKKKSFKL